MAKKRGFLAELNHQKQLADKEREKRQKAAERERAAALKAFEKAQREEQRALAAAAKADADEKKRLEKLAQTAHVEAMTAEAASLNAGLEEQINLLEGLIAATLEVDDHVDLEALKRKAEHLSKHRPDLRPQPLPPSVPPPPKPQFVAPEAGALGRVLGKNKHAEQVTLAEKAHAEAVARWEESVSRHHSERERVVAEHERVEAQRAAELQASYAAHVDEVERDNQAIDTLIANLGYGVAEAVEEYVSIVVSNSVYPEEFDVSHDFEFSGESAELAIRAVIPPPESMPTVKAYKYVKASDEIRATDLSAKARKDLYASAIDQVALRTLHEIFEADRRGLIQTISLEVGTSAPSPATGQPAFMPFAAVSASRDEFIEFDLSAVQPRATLEHLGASISKNAFGLVAANTAGVRAA